MLTLSPQQIVGGFNRREPRAITLIYHKYRNGLFGQILQMVGNTEDAEDIFAAAFSALLEQKGHFDRLSRIRNFLRNSSKNACLNLLAHRKMARSKSEDLHYFYQTLQEASDETDEIAGYYMERVMASVDRLPNRARQVLLLYMESGSGKAEIARKLGISEKTVANRRSQAIRLLKMAILSILIVLIIRLYGKL